jgi:hypothetical protein
MQATWVVTAVALAGAAFMLRFLIALLREGASSVCYLVVPVRRGPKKVVHLKAVRGVYFDDDCRAAESDRSARYLNLLEDEHYAKGKYSSGLIAVDVGPISDGLWRRSIHPGRGNVFRQHWF